MLNRQTLGGSDIAVFPVALGCWPIAGMTSLDVNDQDSIKTLHAACEAGVNFFDTAYAYGADGESERLIARALKAKRDELVIATKCGLAWDDQGQRVVDGRPETLRKQFDESLARLETDHVELLYLHKPDPEVNLRESAGALREIMESGKARLIGVSNFDVAELNEFQKECPISAVQPPYNMVQREIESDIVPWCREHNVSLAVYWPLLKGLLAGKLKRDHVFRPGDGRPKYSMFQGEEWQRNQDLVCELREIARDHQVTPSQLAVRWVLEQPGITAALCGAKRAIQITEVVKAAHISYGEQLRHDLELAIQRRGEAKVQSAV